MIKMPANSFAYEERIVAFVDVLGFSELVKASETDQNALSKLKKLIATDGLFEEFMRVYLDFANSAFFSGSFVLTVNPDQVIYLIRETGNLCRHLLLQGFSCRGGISAGSLYHHGQIVVGPAFISAYQLEKSVAVYPRVIVDDAAMACWKEEFSVGFHRPHLESLIKRDRDGQHFLDIFNPEWRNFIPPTDTRSLKSKLISEAVIATASLRSGKQSSRFPRPLDCFVASLLAMTPLDKSRSLRDLV